MSFWLVGAGRMPRKHAATLPLFEEKTTPCSFSSFFCSGGGVVEDGLEALDKCLGSFESKVSLGELSNIRVLAHPRNKRDCHRWLCTLSLSLQWYSNSLGRKYWRRDIWLR